MTTMYSRNALQHAPTAASDNGTPCSGTGFAFGHLLDFGLLGDERLLA